MKPQRGAVYLDGQSIHQLPTKLVDRQLAVLPQRPEAPGGLEVRELVAYGRFLILIGNEIVELPAAGFLAPASNLCVAYLPASAEKNAHPVGPRNPAISMPFPNDCSIATARKPCTPKWRLPAWKISVQFLPTTSGWPGANIRPNTISAERSQFFILVGTKPAQPPSVGGWGRAAGEPPVKLGGRFAPPQPPEPNTTM